MIVDKCLFFIWTRAGGGVTLIQIVWSGVSLLEWIDAANPMLEFGRAAHGIAEGR